MTYSTLSTSTIHSTQTTTRQHTEILIIITQIMQTVMIKISFTDKQIQCSGEVINNPCIAPRDLKEKLNLELPFICSAYSIYFIIFS